MEVAAETVIETYREIQTEFSDALCGLASGVDRHVTDWKRAEGGGGTSIALDGDGPIEKAAVNFSAISGETPQRLSDALAIDSESFFATGVSIIVHPRNPYAPTFHANIRYFETNTGTSWFGGGADLTPYYLFEEDARHFHSVMRGVCDNHAVADYPSWKKACDEYFYLPHRGEARGVGGIFFDHLTEQLDDVWAFQVELGHALDNAYVPILERRIDTPFGEAEKAWHETRRGRYAEFNLVWDRGTRFGLETSGRTESILASLPPRVRWDREPVTGFGAKEQALVDLVTGEPRDWV